MYLASIGTQSKSDFWFIDSGASFHMTPYKEWFYDYERYNGNVFLGYDSPNKITRCGRVKLLLNDGIIKTFPSVLHITGLAKNLIYVSKMVDADAQTVLQKYRCKMVLGAMVLMRGVRCGTLYRMLGRTIIDRCNSSIVPESKDEESKVPNVSGEDIMLWHQILGHNRERGLQSLQGKGMVEGMSNCNLDFVVCEHCLYVKQNRVKFLYGATRAKEILELIHSDVFGHVHVPSLGGYLYYVSFIDDFSRNTWFYFLKKKSKIFNKFKEFNFLVENQTEKKIKVSRMENGGELCEKEFEQFCKECGIA